MNDYKKQMIEFLQNSPDDYKNDIIKEKRRTGRSTGNALMVIGEALNNPNKKIKMVDHYSNAKHIIQNTQIPYIEEIIEKLNLQCFIINKSEMTITYDLTWLDVL